MPEPQTILAHLRRRAAENAGGLHARYVFQDRPPVEQTYGALERRTRQYAAFLAAHGTRAGHVVLIVLQHHEDMLPAFYGAMWLGAIPALLPYPTGLLHVGKFYSDMRALVARTVPHALLTYRELAGELAGCLKEESRPPALLVFEDVAADASLAGEPHAGDPGDTTMIQYSSGSTGLQKGVALSSRAILEEFRGVAEYFELTRDDVFVTWVPLYHDWGLICGAMHPLALGAPFILISPVHWVGRPALLLELISAHRATVCFQPNFAFNFLAKRVTDAELSGLDLSSLRLICNGAEPCFHESHEMFARRFAQAGFRREALGIVYGMAETVCVVSGAGHREPIPVDGIDRTQLQEHHRAVPVAEDHPAAVKMLGVGRGLAGTHFRVLDETGAELPERHVGEVVIRSPSLFSGYYNNPEVTAQRVRDGWYSSGDLGYRADGILYLTGRKSDLIIIGGENIYPQDVEQMVAEHPHVVPGRVAAIGAVDAELGTQKLVVIAESRSTDAAVHADIKRFVRREVAQRLHVKCDKIVVAPHRWLFKTSSGKIARLPNLRRMSEIDHG